MINFSIKRRSSIIGGLNFQLAYKFDDVKEIDLTKIDYLSSIRCSEFAFSIIEDVFSSSLSYSIEAKSFCHYGFHIHDLESILHVNNKLSAFEEHLQELKETHFIWKRSELLDRESNIQNIRNGVIRLAWSTEEMRNELDENILDANYRKKVLKFIVDIKSFLSMTQNMPNCKGVYVIGV